MLDFPLVHVVLGNEACDLDSAVCAIAYAYYLHEVSLVHCNRVHLHIMFVLMYSVFHSVNVLLCVDVVQSFICRSLVYCNRVHLHIVFVLLYSVFHSVNVLSCVDLIHSFTYVLRVVILDVTERHGESAKESGSDTNCLS